MPARAKHGDTVRVHYTGTLVDGTVFDTTTDRDPLEFEIGRSGLIPGFEEAVVGMEEQEAKTVHIPAAKAYGPRRPEGVFVIDRSKLSAGARPQVGHDVSICAEGKTIVGEVKEVTPTTVTVDTNHLLAGQDLIFDIRLIEIL
jgi:FKBP-type peptidyl-prolyl cis-trans isomerase 2